MLRKSRPTGSKKTGPIPNHLSTGPGNQYNSVVNLLDFAVLAEYWLDLGVFVGNWLFN
jgi:hypothetical protein